MKTLLHRYLSFDGRLGPGPFRNRSTYLGIGTGTFSIASVPLFLTESPLGYQAGVMVVIVALALLALGIAALTVRRLHDLGWSGYHAIWVAAAQSSWAFLAHAPLKTYVLGLPLAAIAVWIMCWPGNRKPNRFGDVPE